MTEQQNNEIAAIQDEGYSNFEAILPVEPLENGMKAVNARKLHEALGSRQHFADWIKGRIKKYNFTENIDFVRQHNLVRRADSNLMNTQTEYWLTIRTAKELSMIENTEMGTKVRRYFIEVEKKASQIEPFADIAPMDIDNMIERIMDTLDKRYISKEAHEKILALELKLARYEWEQRTPVKEREPIRIIESEVVQEKGIMIEPTVKPIEVEQDNNVPIYTVHSGIGYLSEKHDELREDVQCYLLAIDVAVRKGTKLKWSTEWATKNGYGAYDDNKNLRVTQVGIEYLSSLVSSINPLKK